MGRLYLVVDNENCHQKRWKAWGRAGCRASNGRRGRGRLEGRPLSRGRVRRRFVIGSKKNRESAPLSCVSTPFLFTHRGATSFLVFFSSLLLGHHILLHMHAHHTHTRTHSRTSSLPPPFSVIRTHAHTPRTTNLAPRTTTTTTTITTQRMNTTE